MQPSTADSGGQTVLECHQRFSERISGLILADTFAQLDTPERWQMRVKTAERLMAEGMGRYSREELPKMIAPDHVTTMPEGAAHVFGMMESTSPVGAAAALRDRPSARTTLRFSLRSRSQR